MSKIFEDFRANGTIITGAFTTVFVSLPIIYGADFQRRDFGEFFEHKKIRMRLLPYFAVGSIAAIPPIMAAGAFYCATSFCYDPQRYKYQTITGLGTAIMLATFHKIKTIR